MRKSIEEIFGGQRLIPVVTINKLDECLPLGKALEEAGANVIEVTLRTEASFPALKILSEQPNLIIGAGTVTSVEQYKKCVDLGVKFIVSPGSSINLLEEAIKHKVPYMPGAATASEIIQATDYGFYHLKFFPAELAGGINMIKNFAQVFKDVRLCPTGGLNHTNFRKYFDMKNVFAIGGSWMTPSEMVRDKRWDDISKVAKTSIITSRV